MSATYLIICLIISIALVVLFCTKVKMNPAIALILGSLLLGVLTKVPLNDITAADGTVTNGLSQLSTMVWKHDGKHWFPDRSWYRSLDSL